MIIHNILYIIFILYIIIYFRDLIISRLDTFDKSIVDTLKNINIILHKLSIIHTEWEKGSTNKDKLIGLKIICNKVNKLIEITNQIKLKFNLLILENNKLKDTVQSIDCIKNMFQM